MIRTFYNYDMLVPALVFTDGELLAMVVNPRLLAALPVTAAIQLCNDLHACFDGVVRIEAVRSVLRAV